MLTLSILSNFTFQLENTNISTSSNLSLVFQPAGNQTNLQKHSIESSWSQYKVLYQTIDNYSRCHLAGEPYPQKTTDFIWRLSSKKTNKLIKCINGNIKSNINITHWKAGNGHWINKRTEIQNILDCRKPDILLISEANLFLENQPHETCIPGYKLITSCSFEILGYTRMAALIRDRINVEIEGKWMSPEVASIWLKFVKRGARKLYLWNLQGTQNLETEHPQYPR